MPKRRSYARKRRPLRKRRTVRKRRTGRRGRLGRPSRGLAQSVYKFRRKISTVLNIGPGGDVPNGWEPSGDNGIYKQWVFSLDEVYSPGGGSLQLFKAYKITGVKIDLMFNNTNTGDMSGTQMQVYALPWKTGRSRTIATPLTESTVLGTQAHTRRIALNGGKKLGYYMRVNQLSERYDHPLVGGTDYAVVSPKFISTTETGTKHYGLEMYINRVDGLPFAPDPAQSVRITATYYTTFRGVE